MRIKEEYQVKVINILRKIANDHPAVCCYMCEQLSPEIYKICTWNPTKEECGDPEVYLSQITQESKDVTNK